MNVNTTVVSPVKRVILVPRDYRRACDDPFNLLALNPHFLRLFHLASLVLADEQRWDKRDVQ